MVEARDEIRFGELVDGLDGNLGRVKAIGLDRVRCRLHHLAIVFPGIGERWVSEAAIDFANAEVVVLSDGWRALATSEPPTATGVITIRPGRPVQDFDGRHLGRLDGLCIGRDSRKLMALIVRRGILSPESRLVPVHRILAIGPDLFMTDIQKNEWRELPNFESDSALRERVSSALESDDRLQRFVPRAVRVSVEDQRVTIHGYLPSPDLGERAASVAKVVPGVLAVERDIVFDEDLERDVTAALRRDSAMANGKITVRAFLGRVDLCGETPKRFGQRAVELAARVKGVAAVHDFIQVKPRATERAERELVLAA